MKKFLLVLFVVILIIARGAYFFTRRSADPMAWKTYENKTYGVTVQYPPAFELQPSSNTGNSEILIVDPKTHAVYLSVSIYTEQHSKDEVSEYFKGPYPKVIPATGNNSEHTVIQKTLNGLSGIESYGFSGEGTAFDDIFMYENTYLWQVALDPVMQGRQTEEREPGAPVPNKMIYTRILSSLHITP